MEFARVSVVCVFLLYNKKTLQKLVWKNFCGVFGCVQISVLQQIDMKYRKSYNRTDRRLRAVLV